MDSDSQEAPRLLSVIAAACRLGIARRTLEREVQRKRIPPPLKIGSKSLYDVADLDRYVAMLKAERDATA